MASPPLQSSSLGPPAGTGSTPRSGHKVSQHLSSYAVALAWVTVAVAVERLLDTYLVPAPVSVFLCTLMVTASRCGLRPALFAMILSVLAFTYYDIAPTDSFAVSVQEIPRLVLFGVSAAFVVRVTAAQRGAVQALKRSNDALEVVAGKLIHAQEEERRRIGRELHDHISQTVGVLAIKLDQLRLMPGIMPPMMASLDDLRRDTSEIADDVHRLSHRLHSSTLDYLGLVPALQKLVTEVSERHDIAITFTHAPEPAPLPAETALCLFRVAEEALANVVRHSHARTAVLRVTDERDGVHLTVEDDGEGFDPAGPASKAGLGMVSMQERLRAIHGSIRVDSAPACGTRIKASVPAAMPV